MRSFWEKRLEPHGGSGGACTCTGGRRAFTAAVALLELRSATHQHALLTLCRVQAVETVVSSSLLVGHLSSFIELETRILQVPNGVGLALAHKYRKEPNVAVAIYGDGAANQGQVAEVHFSQHSPPALTTDVIIERNTLLHHRLPNFLVSYIHWQSIQEQHILS